MVSTATIGVPVGHVEGPGKVTGAARYAADIPLTGALWGKTLRSPYPHARIRSIDVSRARALPGVRAVLTAADIPDIMIGRRILDLRVLAKDKVRFVGDKVAAVAADSPEIADEALLLIDVEYEELPSVSDPIDAMEDNAPLIHDDPSAYKGAHLPIPDIRNVVSVLYESHGDVEAGFAQADRIFEHTFRTPAVHQGYIEPHACAIEIEPAGKVNVWLCNKTPFTVRGQISAATGVPEDRIRVHLVPLGGDFGGKGSFMDAVTCYHLAAATGRPVKMVMSYTEELMAGNPRHASVITLKTGVTNDGRITARTARAVFNSGAYGAFKPTVHVNLHGATSVGGPYRIPNIHLESLVVYTNTPPAGHMRAPGAPQAVFAAESHMDMIAHEMGLDPAEFRRRNVLREGDSAPFGEKWRDIKGEETLDVALGSAGWTAPKPANVGRGLAMYERVPGGGQSSESVTIDGDANITLLTAVPDTGTGSLTILQQIVAEELQAPLSSVAVVSGDTDTAEMDMGAGGSRVTHGAGQATLAAARELRQALVELAARVMAIAPDSITYRDGRFTAENGQSLSLRELMAKASELEEAPIERVGSYTQSGAPDVTSFIAQVAEVAVDPETGEVSLKKFVTVHDVGTIINPLTHQGQIEGGFVQGMGQALIEQLSDREGDMAALNLGDYKLPTMADIPEFQTVLIESKAGPTPYDGKSIGESSNVSPPAAIANAVFDAVGVRITELPITAEKVYNALRAKENGA